jgi:hypothetical protein
MDMFKKLKLFLTYRKFISQNKTELETMFNIRVDKAQRLYTVINIPEELIGEAYSIKKSDIDRISETYLRQFSSELSNYLDNKNLKELYDVYEIQKVDKYSYLLVFGFSLFKSQKYYNTLYYGVIPGISISIIALLLILL